MSLRSLISTEQEGTRNTYTLCIANGAYTMTHNPAAGIAVAAMAVPWTVACNRYIAAAPQMLMPLAWSSIAGATALLATCTLYCLGHPLQMRKIHNALHRAGLTNGAGEVALYIGQRKDPNNPQITLMDFDANGIAMADWEAKRPELEAALCCYIDRIQWIDDNHHIRLYTSKQGLPDRIDWSDSYLPDKPSELVLGTTIAGPLTVNRDVTPHILIAGSTGSGKTKLMQNLAWQCYLRREWIYVFDAKGGLDYFPKIPNCILATEDDQILSQLRQLKGILLERKDECKRLGVPDVAEYNAHPDRLMTFPRVTVIVDELAEILSKGSTKESKARATEIEDLLSTLARLGRAFHVNLILGTQRPDANIISGQIRNNCDTRICGRCSQNLALVVHDDAQAAEMIPSTARGRFMTHDHVLFQGFLMADEDRKGGGKND